MAARFTLASSITDRIEVFSAYISTFSKRSLSLLLLFTVTISVCFLFSSHSPNFLSTTPDGFRFAYNETHLLSLGRYDCASCKQPDIKGLTRQQIWEACLDPGVVPEYYLTIVLVARAGDNEQYHRVQNAIDSAYAMAEKTKTLTELLFVEWNPKPGRRRLREMYRYRRSEFLTYRIITIPPRLHQLLQGSSDVHEYEARNIGIRFARGEFVVTANPENIWSQNMHNAIVSRSWRKKVFYTQNSRTANGVLEKFATDQQIIDACPYNSFELNSFALPSSVKLELDNYESLTKDSRDFILAHRDTWRMVHGFREARAQTWIDKELLLTAAWTLDIPITHTQETLTCRQQDSPANPPDREEDREGVHPAKMLDKEEKHMNTKGQWALQHLDIWKHGVQCEVFRGGLGV